MRGYVLVNLSVGKEKDFFNATGSLPELLHVYSLFDQFDNLFDPYEYLLELEGSTAEQLVEVMRNQVRRLPGVERAAIFFEKMHEKFPPLDRSRPSKASAGPT